MAQILTYQTYQFLEGSHLNLSGWCLQRPIYHGEDVVLHIFLRSLSEQQVHPLHEYQRDLNRLLELEDRYQLWEDQLHVLLIGTLFHDEEDVG